MRGGPSGFGGDAASEVVDLDQALARVGGDRKLYRELLGMLFEAAPVQTREIGEAIVGGNAKRVEQVAHSLKGAAASLEAGPLRNVALCLEMLGREANLAGAVGVLAELEAELERLHGFAEGLE